MRALARADADMVRRHCGQLSEHFNSVQIMVTKLNPDGTTSCCAWGNGDLLARVKGTEIWLDLAEATIFGQR